MKRFGMMRRGVSVLLLPMVLATGAYGLTASNTVPDTDAGDGTQAAVTGYTISSIDYNMNAATPSDLDSVDFVIDADDGSYLEPEVQVKLDADGAWYSCTAQNDAPAGGDETFQCDTTVGTQLTVANVDQFQVVAVE
jgi:hypothetical protein